MVIRVLFVTNGYPTRKYPAFCVFNKEQIDAVLNDSRILGEIVVINARERGKVEYIKALGIISRRIRDFDIAHCFHGLSFMATALVNNRRPMVASFLNALEHEYCEQPLLSPHLQKLTYGFIERRPVTLIFKDRIPPTLRDRSFHLPNGVDTDRFNIMDRALAKRVLGLDPSRRYVIFVSSKSMDRKQKRYDRFIEVLQILKSSMGDIEKLVIVNEERDRVPFYFNAADIHILTSDFEGSPNSVKESLACGTPVVSTDVGNVRDMLHGAPGCYTAANSDAKTIAALSEQSLRSYVDRRAVRSEVFRKGLDLRSTTDALIRIYRATLDKYDRFR